MDAQASKAFYLTYHDGLRHSAFLKRDIHLTIYVTDLFLKRRLQIFRTTRKCFLRHTGAVRCEFQARYLNQQQKKPVIFAFFMAPYLPNQDHLPIQYIAFYFYNESFPIQGIAKKQKGARNEIICKKRVSLRRSSHLSAPWRASHLSVLWRPHNLNKVFQARR